MYNSNFSLDKPKGKKIERLIVLTKMAAKEQPAVPD
jgi:hypothetical protein